MERGLNSVNDLESRYDALFAAVGDAVLIATGAEDTSRIVDCNPAALVLFGAHRSDLLGQSPFDVTRGGGEGDEALRAVFARHIHEALRGMPQRFEWRHARSDGAILETEVRLHRLDLAGIPHLQFVLRRVSPPSAPELDWSYHGAPAEVWQRRVEAGMETRDAGLNRVLGLDARRTRQPVMDFLERVHPADRPRVQHCIDDAVGSGRDYVEAFRVVRPDGSIRWLKERATVRRDARDGPRYMTGSVVELSAPKPAQPEYRADEEHYRSLVDNVPVGLYRTAPDGHILFANDALVRMLGFPDKATLLGANVRSLFVGADARARALHDLDEDGKPHTFEFQLRRHDGRVVWVRDYARKIVAADDFGHRYEGSLEDISKEREAEEELRKTRDTLDHILRSATEYGIVAMDLDLNVIHASDAVERILGIRPTEILGHRLDCVEQVSRVDSGRFHDALRTAERTGAWTKEMRLEGDDGSERYVHSVVSPMRGSDGALVGYVMMACDVTERYRADRVLRASERKLRAIFEQAAVGFGKVETSTLRFVKVNKKLCEILGRPEREILQTTCAGLTYLDDVPGDMECLKQLRAGEISYFSREKRFVRPDGELVWVNMTISALWKPEEAPEHHLIIVEDISGRKRAESERNKYQHDLRHAHKLQAVGQLAAGVAHDFNSLLMVIQGNFDLLRAQRKSRGSRDQTEEEAWNRVYGAVERGTSLVRKLLLFGRADRGRAHPVDVNRVLRDTEGLFGITLEDAVEVRTECEPELWRICIDSGQLQQVLINLVLNARDALGGRGFIKLKTANVMRKEEDVGGDSDVAAGPHVMIAIEDNGEGISPEVMERLFEPFFSTKPVGKGAGLGLSIVHGSVRNARGQIEVESEVGKGAIFRLYFPAEAETDTCRVATPTPPAVP